MTVIFGIIFTFKRGLNFFKYFDAKQVIAGAFSQNFTAIYTFKRQNWEMYRIDKKWKIIDGKEVDFINYSMSREEWNGE